MDFRGCTGYSGCEPGQIDTGPEHGGWIIVPADADDVFTMTPVIASADFQAVPDDDPTS